MLGDALADVRRIGPFPCFIDVDGPDVSVETIAAAINFLAILGGSMALRY